MIIKLKQGVDVVTEEEEQQWQPLGDGRWGRVVGREGAERSWAKP
jgi:hypothetical protein